MFVYFMKREKAKKSKCMSDFPVRDTNAASMGIAKVLPDLFSKLSQSATLPTNRIMSFFFNLFYS